jgi:predicted nucleic acid-binding Zn ribbon protein
VRHKDAPVSVGSLLANSKALKSDTRVGWHTWRSIVGHRVAKHSMPTRLEAGTLQVTVSSSIWASELSLLQAPILERLRAVLPAVRMLRFRVGQVTLPPLAPATRVGRAELPDALARSLESVEDTDLRRIISEAAAYTLGRKS